MMTVSFQEGVAWDCDPMALVYVEPYDIDLDEEDAASDWQILALDRFGDRTITYGDEGKPPRSAIYFC